MAQHDTLQPNINAKPYWVAGTSITYIPFGPAAAGYYYHEWSWSLNLARDFGFGLRTGVNSITILTNTTFSDPQTFWMGGGFVQYDFWPHLPNRFFPEVGLYYGDYCSCDIDSDPSREDGIVYISIGAGGTFRVLSRIDLDLAMLFHYPLSKVQQQKSATRQYIFGVDYRFIPQSETSEAEQHPTFW